MARSNRELRDGLLKAETWSTGLRERYEENRRSLLEGKLSRSRRWLIAIVGVPSCLLTAFVCSLVALRVEGLWPKTGLVLVGLYGLFCAGALVAVAIQGVVRWDSHLARARKLTTAAVLLFAVAALLTASQAPDPVSSLQVAALSLLGLVPASLFIVLARIREAEIAMLSTSLRLEWRLLELDHLASPRLDDGDADRNPDNPQQDAQD